MPKTGDVEQVAALATSSKAPVDATERLANPSLIAVASALQGSLLAVVDHDAGVARLENALDAANSVDARLPADTAPAHLACTPSRMVRLMRSPSSSLGSSTTDAPAHSDKRCG